MDTSSSDCDCNSKNVVTCDGRCTDPRYYCIVKDCKNRRYAMGPCCAECMLDDLIKRDVLRGYPGTKK